MPKINAKTLTWSIRRVERMSLAEKETELDEIYVQQPNLLASVLVQQRLGNTLEQMEVLLNLLLVIHVALKKVRIHIETVSEDEQDRQLQRYIASVNFTDGLNDDLYDKSIAQYINTHKEQMLFAYAHKVVMDAGFPYLQYENSKHLSSCAMNLVNCVANAKTVTVRSAKARAK